MVCVLRQSVRGRAHDFATTGSGVRSGRTPPVCSVGFRQHGGNFLRQDRRAQELRKGGQMSPSFSLGRTTKCQSDFSGEIARGLFRTRWPEAALRVHSFARRNWSPLGQGARRWQRLARQPDAGPDWRRETLARFLPGYRKQRPSRHPQNSQWLGSCVQVPRL